MNKTYQKQRGSVAQIVIVLAVLVVLGGIYIIWHANNRSGPGEMIRDEMNGSTADNIPSKENASTTMQVTIMVPADMSAYQKSILNYVQIGGADPIKDIKFVSRSVSVPFSSDVIKASAEAAANVITTQASSIQPQIIYFKVVHGTAYVITVMDVDAWAGVSVSKAQAYPLIEKTLLRFSEIKSVKFGPAPGDNLSDIQNNYNQRVNEQDVAPVIDSINPSSGPVGTTIEIKGTNLAGFEGDRNVWIQAPGDKGVKGIVYGSASSTDSMIVFRLADRYCTKDNSYSGLPCADFLKIMPGEYKIFAYPWGKESNKVKFTVTDSPQTVTNWKTYSNPEIGISFKYPSTWYVTSHPDSKIGDISVMIQSDTKHQYFEQNPDGPGGPIAEISISKFSLGYREQNTSPVVFNGMSANKSTFQGDGPIFNSVLVDSKRYTYKIVTVQGSDKAQIESEILLTLKFTN